MARVLGKTVITPRDARTGSVKKVTMTITGVGFQRQIDAWWKKAGTKFLDRRYADRIRDRYKEVHDDALSSIVKNLSASSGVMDASGTGGQFRLPFYSQTGSRASAKTGSFTKLTDRWLRYKKKKGYSARFWRASGDMARAWEAEKKPIRARKTTTKPVTNTRKGYRYVTGYEFYGWPELFMKYISLPITTGEHDVVYGNAGSRFARGTIEQAVWLEEGTSRNLPERPFIRRFSAEMGRDLKSSLQRG